MPVTNYHTLNGELLGETGPGGRRFYGKDALGSVVATYDQNGTLENTYRYKPYGGLLSKTGIECAPTRYITKSFMVEASSGVSSYQSEGSWCIRNKGPIPPSNVIAGGYRLTTSCFGPAGRAGGATDPYQVGVERFAFKIKPTKVQPFDCPRVTRSELWLHPDGNLQGTAGCIGIKTEQGSNKARSCLEVFAMFGCPDIPLTVVYI